MVSSERWDRERARVMGWAISIWGAKPAMGGEGSPRSSSHRPKELKSNLSPNIHCSFRKNCALKETWSSGPFKLHVSTVFLTWVWLEVHVHSSRSQHSNTFSIKLWFWFWDFDPHWRTTGFSTCHSQRSVLVKVIPSTSLDPMWTKPCKHPDEKIQKIEFLLCFYACVRHQQHAKIHK